MKTGRIASMAVRRGVAGALAFGAGAAFMVGIVASPVTAQSTGDCRCVDRDGNEIERCSCFRQPRFEMFGKGWATQDARPRIGVSVDARQSTRRDGSGALVTDVMNDGPADRAGIRRGDFITSIDGHSLFEPLAADVERNFDLDDSMPVQRLLAIARGLEPGQQVSIEYERDGESHTATIEAQELPAWGSVFVGPGFDGDQLWGRLGGLPGDVHAFEYRSDALEDLGDRIRDEVRMFRRDRDRDGERAGPTVRSFGDGPGLTIERYRGLGYGLELVALNPSLGAYFGADEGVLVADVDDDSTLGLRPGDVVTAIGDRPVTTPDRMRRILQSYGPDEEITLQVRRDGHDTMVTGTLGR